MRAFVKTLLFLAPFFSSYTEEDQLHILFGSSGYVLYKVLDFANDHGYRYMKILSYEFKGYNHTVSGICSGETKGGRYFELEDQIAKVSFVCFKEKPQDPFLIDLEKYHSLLHSIAKQAEK